MLATQSRRLGRATLDARREQGRAQAGAGVRNARPNTRLSTALPQTAFVFDHRTPRWCHKAEGGLAGGGMKNRSRSDAFTGRRAYPRASTSESLRLFERSAQGARSEFRSAPRECIDPGSRSEAKADGSALTDQATRGFAARNQERKNAVHPTTL
jgi:hypothetical protein